MVQIKAGRQVTEAAIEGLHIGVVASWHPLCQSDPRIFYQVLHGSKYQRWITQQLFFIGFEADHCLSLTLGLTHPHFQDLIDVTLADKDAHSKYIDVAAILK